jgi:hypothetical protein
LTTPWTCGAKPSTPTIIEAANRLAEESRQEPVWIIFNTLSRVLAGGDENSPRDMGALVASVDCIFRATGAHCSLVHPLGESAQMRGHTSFNGTMDATVRIEKRDGVITLEVDKASDLPDTAKAVLPLQVGQVDFGPPHHGIGSDTGRGSRRRGGHHAIQKP